MIVKYLECFLVMSWPCAEGLLLQQRNYWSSRHHHRKNNKQQLCYNVAFKLSNYAGLIEYNTNMIFDKRLMFDALRLIEILVYVNGLKTDNFFGPGLLLYFWIILKILSLCDIA